MASVSLLFFRSADDSIPALEWLEVQPLDARAKCVVAIRRLEAEGHTARRPLVENLGDGLYELRVRVGRMQYRLLYSFFGRNAVIFSHGLVKERSIPMADLDVARRRKAEFETDPSRHAVEVDL